ncbi:MAG TPA: hypothetical protein VGD67_27630 [Pseudonocardiaceae bacterium]
MRATIGSPPRAGRGTPVRVPPEVFDGHYPGFPLLPGMVLLGLVDDLVRRRRPGLPVTGLRAGRFLAPVAPGTGLVVHLAESPGTTTATVTDGTRTVAELALDHSPVPGPAAPWPPPDTVPDTRPDTAPDTAPDVDVTAVIPHRGAMLLVDGVRAATGDRLVAEHGVRRAGGLPPWLAVESWAQAALLLALADRPVPDVLTAGVPVLAALDDVRLGPGALAPLPAGTVLVHHVRLRRRPAGTAWLDGVTTTAAGVLLGVGRVLVATRPVADLRPPSPEESR